MFRKQPFIFLRINYSFTTFCKTIFLLIVILFFYSCEFKPSEIPETFVKPPGDEAPLLFVQVKPEMDTLPGFFSPFPHGGCLGGRRRRRTS